MEANRRGTRSASQGDLRIFTQLVRAEAPLTAMELVERTEMPDGTVYPVIGKLAAKGLVIHDTLATPNTVTLAPTFEAWEYILDQLRLVQVFTGPIEMLNPYSQEASVSTEV